MSQNPRAREANLLFRLMQHFYVEDGVLCWKERELYDTDPKLNNDLVEWAKMIKVSDCL